MKKNKKNKNGKKSKKNSASNKLIIFLNIVKLLNGIINIIDYISDLLY